LSDRLVVEHFRPLAIQNRSHWGDSAHFEKRCLRR